MNELTSAERKRLRDKQALALLNSKSEEKPEIQAKSKPALQGADVSPAPEVKPQPKKK